MSTDDDSFDDIPKGKTPDIVKDKLTTSVDFKIIGIIVTVIIAIQGIIHYSDEEPVVLIYVLSMGIPLTIAILSFITAKKYSGVLVYGRGYIALGLAFIGLFLAELTYMVYEQFLNLDPYPSIADVFFYLLYVLIIAYLLIHIQFFATKIKTIDKLWIAIIPISITAIYWAISISIIGELNFDFYYGIAFVSITSVALALSIFGVKIFKQGLVGTHWILLSVGILLLSIGDTWYYILELFEGYDLVHPVNILWYAGYFLIVYALLHHRKILQ